MNRSVLKKYMAYLRRANTLVAINEFIAMMHFSKNPLSGFPYRIMLGSQSPRRQALLEGLAVPFTVEVRLVDETCPEYLQGGEIPAFLSQLKAGSFREDLEADPGLMLITADTIVWLDEQALNKPADEAEAIAMIRQMSGRMHEVFTGVTLSTRSRSETFTVRSEVYFREIPEDEIRFYIDYCKPYDKAGSYGIQEWIGYTCIEKINGSFFNVMGLPTMELYQHLLQWPEK